MTGDTTEKLVRFLGEPNNGLIGVDVDEVLVGTLDPLCELYNRDWSDTLTPAEITDWDLTRFVRSECGRAVYRYFAHPDLYEMARPVPGAIEGVEALRSAGYRVLFVTSSLDGQGDPKREWLRRHGFISPADRDPAARDVCQMADKFLLPVSLLIDDYIGNHEYATYPGVLFPAPYNVGLGDGERVIRPAGGWADIVAALSVLRDRRARSSRSGVRGERHKTQV